MSERIVTVHKAQSIEGRPPVPSISISIGGSGEFPRLRDLERADAVRDVDARVVATALRESLPGGTFERVVGLLVLDTASRLVIPLSDAPYVARVASVTRRGLGRAQQLLAHSSVDGYDEERAEARAAIAWLDDQICGGRMSGSLLSLEDAEVAGSTSEPPLVASGFMTWRDLDRRLRELAVVGGDALDQEVVVRVEGDDESLHCGGLESVDVETGCTEQPALVLDASSVSICEDAVPFADGALGSGRAAVFRRHLGSCTSCMAKLAEALQLSAQVGDLGSPRRTRLVAAGVAAEHCAILDAFVREHRYSDSPDAVVRASAVRAAISLVAGGPSLSADVAGILVSLRRRWMAETAAPSPFLESLCVLMGALGLNVGHWSGRHSPTLVDAEAHPGFRIAGCSCGWCVPASATEHPMEAFDLHQGDALADETREGVANILTSSGVERSPHAHDDR